MAAEHHPDEHCASEQKAERLQQAREDGQADNCHALFLKPRLKLRKHTERVEIDLAPEQQGEIDEVILNSTIMGSQVKQQHSGSGLVRGHFAPLNDGFFSPDGWFARRVLSSAISLDGGRKNSARVREKRERKLPRGSELDCRVSLHITMWVLRFSLPWYRLPDKRLIYFESAGHICNHCACI
jgi:hypothetical protein